MILYHGTNTDIESIDLGLSRVGKDFGVGFYLTPEYNVAARQSFRRADISGGNPIVLTFEFDENGMTRIDALRTIYNSMTYIKLQDTANGLFAQGTPYIYDCLMQEIQNGKVF